MLNFLPGPVAVSDEARAAFSSPPVWHRSDVFLERYSQTRQLLKNIGKSKYVSLMMGTGTMANAVVAQELKKLPSSGLIMANGEFGERLIRQASQAGLNFDAYKAAWGQRFSPAKTQELLADKEWLWLAQCETSTGAINLEPWLIRYCREHSIKLCLDGISAAGCMEVDFSGIYLASCSSGKGFESYAGIAIVFYNHEPAPGSAGHPYLDLGLYHEAAEPPFTFSSNMLFALHAALKNTDYQAKYKHNAVHAAKIGRWLHRHNLSTPLVESQQAAHVWSIALDPARSSSETGAALEREGIVTHCKNSYLQKNNWLQFSLVTNHSDEDVDTMLEALGRILSR